MKIAVCDDEKFFLDTLREHICEISESAEVFEYLSGEELVSDYFKGKFDIVILDIEMKELSGLQTAEFIRKTDSTVIIAFLTSHAEFAIRGYEVSAFRYILKNQPEFLYMKQLRSIIDEYLQHFHTFTISNAQKTVKLKLNDIIYFEVFSRTIVVHTVDGTYEYYGKMLDVEAELKNESFVKPSKSYLVNLYYVSFIEKGFILLKGNNAKIPIGRAMKQRTTEAYMNYLAGR